jgi:hypothetical protein
MQGAMTAVASAPVIFAVAIGVAKLMIALLVIGVIARLVWVNRVS